MPLVPSHFCNNFVIITINRNQTQNDLMCTKSNLYYEDDLRIHVDAIFTTPVVVKFRQYIVLNI
jgi:hypothetical protein